MIVSETKLNPKLSKFSKHTANLRDPNGNINKQLTDVAIEKIIKTMAIRRPDHEENPLEGGCKLIDVELRDQTYWSGEERSLSAFVSFESRKGSSVVVKFDKYPIRAVITIPQPNTCIRNGQSIPAWISEFRTAINRGYDFLTTYWGKMSDEEKKWKIVEDSNGQKSPIDRIKQNPSYHNQPSWKSTSPKLSDAQKRKYSVEKVLNSYDTEDEFEDENLKEDEKDDPTPKPTKVQKKIPPLYFYHQQIRKYHTSEANRLHPALFPPKNDQVFFSYQQYFLNQKEYQKSYNDPTHILNHPVAMPDMTWVPKDSFDFEDEDNFPIQVLSLKEYYFYSSNPEKKQLLLSFKTKSDYDLFVKIFKFLYPSPTKNEVFQANKKYREAPLNRKNDPDILWFNEIVLCNQERSLLTDFLIRTGLNPFSWVEFHQNKVLPLKSYENHFIRAQYAYSTNWEPKESKDPPVRWIVNDVSLPPDISLFFDLEVIGDGFKMPDATKKAHKIATNSAILTKGSLQTKILFTHTLENLYMPQYFTSKQSLEFSQSLCHKIRTKYFPFFETGACENSLLFKTWIEDQISSSLPENLKNLQNMPHSNAFKTLESVALWISESIMTKNLRLSIPKTKKGAKNFGNYLNELAKKQYKLDEFIDIVYLITQDQDFDKYLNSFWDVENEDHIPDDTYIFNYENEEQMLVGMSKILFHPLISPNKISGWNIFGFDLKYWYTRMVDIYDFKKNHPQCLYWGKLKTILKLKNRTLETTAFGYNNWDIITNCMGLIAEDAMILYKNFIKDAKAFSLKVCSNQFLKQTINIPPKQLLQPPPKVTKAQDLQILEISYNDSLPANQKVIPMSKEDLPITLITSYFMGGCVDEEIHLSFYCLKDTLNSMLLYYLKFHDFNESKSKIAGLVSSEIIAGGAQAPIAAAQARHFDAQGYVLNPKWFHPVLNTPPYAKLTSTSAGLKAEFYSDKSKFDVGDTPSILGPNFFQNFGTGKYQSSSNTNTQKQQQQESDKDNPYKYDLFGNETYGKFIDPPIEKRDYVVFTIGRSGDPQIPLAEEAVKWYTQHSKEREKNIENYSEYARKKLNTDAKKVANQKRESENTKRDKISELKNNEEAIFGEEYWGDFKEFVGSSASAEDEDFLFDARKTAGGVNILPLITSMYIAFDCDFASLYPSAMLNEGLAANAYIVDDKDAHNPGWIYTDVLIGYHWHRFAKFSYETRTPESLKETYPEFFKNFEPTKDPEFYKPAPQLFMVKGFLNQRNIYKELASFYYSLSNALKNEENPKKSVFAKIQEKFASPSVIGVINKTKPSGLPTYSIPTLKINDPSELESTYEEWREEMKTFQETVQKDFDSKIVNLPVAFIILSTLISQFDSIIQNITSNPLTLAAENFQKLGVVYAILELQVKVLANASYGSNLSGGVAVSFNNFLRVERTGKLTFFPVGGAIPTIGKLLNIVQAYKVITGAGLNPQEKIELMKSRFNPEGKLAGENLLGTLLISGDTDSIYIGNPYINKYPSDKLSYGEILQDAYTWARKCEVFLNKDLIKRGYRQQFEKLGGILYTGKPKSYIFGPYPEPKKDEHGNYLANLKEFDIPKDSATGENKVIRKGLAYAKNGASILSQTIASKIENLLFVKNTKKAEQVVIDSIIDFKEKAEKQPFYAIEQTQQRQRINKELNSYKSLDNKGNPKTLPPHVALAYRNNNRLQTEFYTSGHIIARANVQERELWKRFESKNFWIEISASDSNTRVFKTFDPLYYGISDPSTVPHIKIKLIKKTRRDLYVSSAKCHSIIEVPKGISMQKLKNFIGKHLFVPPDSFHLFKMGETGFDPNNDTKTYISKCESEIFYNPKVLNSQFHQDCVLFLQPRDGVYFLSVSDKAYFYDDPDLILEYKIPIDIDYYLKKVLETIEELFLPFEKDPNVYVMNLLETANKIFVQKKTKVESFIQTPNSLFGSLPSFKPAPKKIHVTVLEEEDVVDDDSELVFVKSTPSVSLKREIEIPAPNPKVLKIEEKLKLDDDDDLVFVKKPTKSFLPKVENDDDLIFVKSKPKKFQTEFKANHSLFGFLNPFTRK